MPIAARSAVVRNARLAVVLAAAATASIVEHASANRYVGGLWNNPASWNDGYVPDLGTSAEFNSDHSGVVQVNGGARADNVSFGNNTNGYRIQGEPTATLTTRLINNGGENNSIETATIRGVNVDPEHGYLDINSGTLWSGGLDHLRITSNIINAQDFDNPNAGPAATDVYANGTFSGIFYNTGATTIYGASRFIGTNGSIAASNNVTISHGAVYLDSTEGHRDDRISNSAVVHLDAGELVLKGDNAEGTINEIVGSIVVGAGLNGIAIQDNATLSVAASPNLLTRDNAVRGTLHLDGENHLKLTAAGLVGGVVPYAIITSDNGYHLPVRYDKGVDNAAGTADDGGLVPVSTVDLNTALTTGGDALIQTVTTLAQTNKTINSLSLVNGTLNTGSNSLFITSGVVNIDSFTGSNVALTGNSVISAANGAEMIIYNHGRDTELAGHIGGGNGLTITSYNGSEYLGTGNKITLSGSNSYSGPTTINSGELIVANAQAIPAGSTLRLFDCNVNFNYAPSAAITGRIILNGDVDLQSSARDNFLRDFRLKDNTTFAFSGGIEGHGAYFLQGTNSTMSVTAPIGITATAASGGFSIWPTETNTLRINGQLGADNSPGSVIQFGGATVGNGRITGGLQLSSGTLAPGSNGATGTGLLRIRDLSLGGGEAHFNINSLTRGSGYDAIDVDNYVFTSTDTKIVLDAGGLTGTIGQRFTLINYTNLYSAGRPSFVSNLASQVGTHWVPIWGDQKFEVAVAGPGGDSNLDGRTNFDDLIILAQHYNTEGSYLQGDSTNDGRISFDDLIVLAQNYNAKIPGLLGLGSNFAADWALAQSVVPEPTTLGVMAVGMFCLTRPSRSR